MRDAPYGAGQRPRPATRLTLCGVGAGSAGVLTGRSAGAGAGHGGRPAAGGGAQGAPRPGGSGAAAAEGGGRDGGRRGRGELFPPHCRADAVAQVSRCRGVPRPPRRRDSGGPPG